MRLLTLAPITRRTRSRPTVIALSPLNVSRCSNGEQIRDRATQGLRDAFFFFRGGLDATAHDMAEPCFREPSAASNRALLLLALNDRDFQRDVDSGWHAVNIGLSCLFVNNY